MIDVAEILKNTDREKSMNEFMEARKLREEKKELFWNSELCETMIQDMIKVNQGFDEETFSYFPEKVKAQFGWGNISNDDIQQFINVMADSTIGVTKGSQPEVDEEDDDCMFDNSNFIKRGIDVFVMYGQGRAVRLSPVES
jgi:hypothetical protein